ncbi:uncharacterized protein LOC142140288 isoform X2 [Mixophyes fleayi]|uniref:uncharacterized protein LOC142140288 isoform X2 n=1 Tax=Mixophyes fleayi TaxID=3061075 RepID=UPI003F4DF36C
MGIIHLLSIIKAALCKILSLCSLAWITSVISQGSSTEGKMQRPSLKQDKLYSDCEELKEDLRQMQDISPSSMSRQFRFEEKVEKLESDLFGEKELWRTKFQELLQDQQSLKEQQQKCIHLEECKKSRHLMPPYGDVTDGVMESDINVRDGLHRRLGDQVKTSVCDCNNLTLLDGYKSLERPSLNRILPMPSTPIFHPGSTNGWKTQKCFRVFAPRCPLDLKIGNRVKVILPSGRIGIGAVCKVGKLPGKVEFQVGVDLEPPECWQQVGVFKGQYNFHSDPGSGVFVPFSKVLMVWE